MPPRKPTLSKLSSVFLYLLNVQWVSSDNHSITLYHKLFTCPHLRHAPVIKLSSSGKKFIYTDTQKTNCEYICLYFSVSWVVMGAWCTFYVFFFCSMVCCGVLQLYVQCDMVQRGVTAVLSYDETGKIWCQCSKVTFVQHWLGTVVRYSIMVLR